MRLTFAPLFAVAVLIGVPALAESQAMTAPDMQAMSAKALDWSELVAPGFLPGAKMAVVVGNPAEAVPYTMRLSFPDGYAIPAHWHPNAENVTVLSGTLMMAMGERVDATMLKKYGPGDFMMVAAKKPHFGSAVGATVVQLHGMGPFTIELVTNAMK